MAELSAAKSLACVIRRTGTFVPTSAIAGTIERVQLNGKRGSSASYATSSNTFALSAEHLAVLSDDSQGVLSRCQLAGRFRKSLPESGCANVDIEDRKHADQALRTSERNLTLIINTIPMLAWATRPDGYCDFLNQRWLDYAGMPAEQAYG